MNINKNLKEVALKLHENGKNIYIHIIIKLSLEIHNICWFNCKQTFKYSLTSTIKNN